MMSSRQGKNRILAWALHSTKRDCIDLPVLRRCRRRRLPTEHAGRRSLGPRARAPTNRQRFPGERAAFPQNPALDDGVGGGVLQYHISAWRPIDLDKFEIQQVFGILRNISLLCHARMVARWRGPVLVCYSFIMTIINMKSLIGLLSFIITMKAAPGCPSLFGHEPSTKYRQNVSTALRIPRPLPGA